MKTIAIIFVGLIIRVNQPWSFDNTAVLPDVMGHTADLVIPIDSIIEPAPWVKKLMVQGAQDVVIPLQGRDVRVKGTRGIFSNFTKDYMATVPPLRSIAPSCGKPLSEVKKRLFVSNVLGSFIDFRGGTIEPYAFLQHTLRFENGPGAWAAPNGQCTSCAVRYKADLRNDEATLVVKEQDGSAREIRIRGGAELKVRNLPNNPQDPHFHGHYSIYSQSKCTQSTGLIPTVVRTVNCQRTECTSAVLAARVPAVVPAAPGDDCSVVHDP